MHDGTISLLQNEISMSCRSEDFCCSFFYEWPIRRALYESSRPKCSLIFNERRRRAGPIHI